MTDPVSDTSIAQELTRLREEVATLREANQQLRESEERFHRLAEASPHGVVISVRGTVVDLNRRIEEIVGFQPREGIGVQIIDYVAPGSRTKAAAHIQEGYEIPYESELQRVDGTTVPVTLTGKTISYRGQPARVTIVEDLTERKQAEVIMREAMQREALIIAQEETLAMLSVPLLPILDNVVLMPLVGDLNHERNQRIMEVLCHGVVEHSARMAILDITGLSNISPEGAEGIARAARAVELLGSKVILTGVTATVASEMVRLDIDMQQITVLPTLARGVSHALRHRLELR